MLGVIVNVLTVLLGGSIGLLAKKGVPEKLQKGIMCALGLCTLYIGISGALEGNNVLVLIFSMVVGSAMGTLLDIDAGLNRLGEWVERKFSRGGDTVSVAEGFVTSSLLFCVGAMTIVGSLQAGLVGDNSTLFTKAMLDFCSSMMLASSLGVGVILSSVVVLVLQGGLVLLSGILEPFLNADAITAMTMAGSLIIVGLGLNLLGITKIKVANQLPAIVCAPVFLAVYNFVFSLIGT